ncbi:hypothetical protein D9613_011934 [Agrocybe pediades]|uniref:KOW domain-containing protein n=1 Tax=Agrocybe pediades TaxID=84607 RepID=A0A8H4QF00_9AGAR|nr:hypothetical protein D9613_011934 [Agrocybe pediades]
MDYLALWVVIKYKHSTDETEMSEQRSAKRRRIAENPFVDIEAIAGSDNEEEEGSEDDSDFIVDGAIDIDEDDLLSADRTPSSGPSRLTPSVDPAIDEQYSALFGRALARGAKRSPLERGIHEGVGDVLLGRRPSTDKRTWVRIRPMKGTLSTYVGDLALAIRSDTPNRVDYWIVPRTALVKEKKATRPSQALFNPSLARAEEGEDAVQHIHSEGGTCSYHTQAACYSKQGFLLVSGPPTIALSFSGQVLPTPREFDTFSACEALDPAFLLETKSLMARNSIVRGDRVKCIAGELQNLIGVVLECDEDSLNVHFESLDIDYSVMRYEVRKYFRVGDRVIINDGGAGERKGWIIGCEETSVCVFDPKTKEELPCSWHQLRFDDTVDSYRLRNLSRSSSFQLQEQHAMRENPNHRFEKKAVLVTGNHYKGVRGIITDTTIDGYAFVSLALFNHPRKEKIKLSDLQIIVPGKDREYLVPIVSQPNSFISTLPKLPPLISLDSSSTPSSSQTPMPTTPLSGNLLDAWNPAASTPLWSLSPGIMHSSSVTQAVSVRPALELPWLSNPIFNTARVKLKLCLRNDRTRLFEMRTVNNDIVTVRDGRQTLDYPLADLDFIRPEGCTDPVVSFAQGELFGKIFRVKEFGPVETVILHPGEIKFTESFPTPTSNYSAMGKQRLSAKDARKRRLETEVEEEADERSRKKTATSASTDVYATFESRSPSKITSQNVLHPPLAAPPILADTPPNPDDGRRDSAEATGSKELEDFENAKLDLMHYLLQREYHPLVEEPCPCGRGERLVGCSECLGHNIVCKECFISKHATVPTHWARVWQKEGRFFTKCDISTLRPEGYAIPLGHNGERCPSPFDLEDDTGIILVDHNGVHQTRLHYCTCDGIPNRIEQLISAGLFPATMRLPRTAFTSTVLQQFHIHHLESKESAFDFIGSLRRLTDNFFATATSDPYEQFLKVIRFWRALMATKRLGQAHGIDKHLPQLREGNLQILCPACMQPGINTEKGWEKNLYPHLRHLHQISLTADGNFHTTRYKKNGSTDDYSLFAGRAYYGEQEDFKQYLRSLPAKDIEDKVTCAVKAVTNQNRVVDNLAETGTINIQCPHCIVLSTVDLQRGERFANTDYALARMLHLNRDLCDPSKPFLNNVDFLFSYDISCAYNINITKRFQERFPDLTPAVRRFRFVVPLVHIHNHKENCMYLYSSSYTECAGHFHGETAEFEWPEVNQLAPQTRQMNEGARQDALIGLHGDWNLKKVVNMSTLLLANLIHARKVFGVKRDQFITLTILYGDRVPMWNTRDRNARIKNKSNEIEWLLAIAKQRDSVKTDTQGAFGDLDSRAAILGLKLVNEGLIIEEKQREITQALSRLHAAGHPTARLKPSEISDSSVTQRLENTVESLRTKLRPRLTKWKEQQHEFMGSFISDLRASIQERSSLEEPEQDMLFLPSYFSKNAIDISIEVVKINALLRSEHDLRKGRAFDAIREVQQTAKSLSVMKGNTPQAVNSYSACTRAQHQVADIESKLELQISDYNTSRDALIALCGADSIEAQLFPVMTVGDTYRSPTHLRREIGSSTRQEGRMYNVGITAGVRVSMPSTLQFGPVKEPTGVAAAVKTQGTNLSSPWTKKVVKERKGKSRRVDIEEIQSSEDSLHATKLPRKDHGWIWRLGAMQDLSEKDLQEWSDESDSIQWFRAEAEMQRWQEEHEIVQAQFVRCIRAFHTMSKVWTRMSDDATASPGHQCYARKMAARYSRLEIEARGKFASAGYANKIVGMDKGLPLAEMINADREVAEKDISISNILGHQHL